MKDYGHPIPGTRKWIVYKKLLKHRAKSGDALSQDILKSWHLLDSLGRERVPRRRLTKSPRYSNPITDSGIIEGVTVMKGVILVDDPHYPSKNHLKK